MDTWRCALYNPLRFYNSVWAIGLCKLFPAFQVLNEARGLKYGCYARVYRTFFGFLV
ncbi:L-cystine transporter, partial [Salmonella enterica]|nr:L-cystine transporter [Salmonella enterica]